MLFRLAFTAFLAAVFVLPGLLLAAEGDGTRSVPDTDGNRLAYLDEPCDPYYPHLGFAKLTTPQWVGEEGVECVVTLAIDDMREPAKYEAFFRPILERLKKIDGRAPMSIMTCSVKPDDPQLAAWLKEGLSIECHTVDHPCPLLAGGDFAKAKSTYERCVDLMASIPGNRPVAFRMPCCDSKNTPSPRFWTEIFNKTTEKGNFLSLDSSVFCILTSKDKSLPSEITLNEAGEERFRRYVPFKSFVNTIEDYPYPYVIARQCWEFPCIVPSDWEAQYVQKPNNPDTVRDLKLALDAVVLKQGVYNLVFHPHGWIRAEQVVELIDHAVAKHGKKVKFLTFRECEERLTKNLLGGQTLRNAKGEDNGVRVLDVNNDGYMDVLLGAKNRLRIWNPKEGHWINDSFDASEAASFGVLEKDGVVSMAKEMNLWHFREGRWQRATPYNDVPPPRPPGGDRWHRLLEVDGDGVCELIVLNEVVRFWDGKSRSWEGALPIPHPKEVPTDARYIRFVDLNGDGKLDYIYSSPSYCAVRLFESRMSGWSKVVLEGAREGLAGQAIPPFAHADGSNAGVWIHSGHFWWQNEHTDKLPDGVDRRSFADLLKPLADKEAKKAAAEKSPPVLIGAAKVDITPDYPVRLTGYAARSKETSEISQRIYARALAIGGEIECCGDVERDSVPFEANAANSELNSVPIIGSPPPGSSRRSDGFALLPRAANPLAPAGFTPVGADGLSGGRHLPQPFAPTGMNPAGARVLGSGGVVQNHRSAGIKPAGAVNIGIANTSKPNSAAILITVDNCGVCANIVEEVRKQLAAKAGIAPERVAICSTHTHSAPMANGFAPMMFGPPLPPDQQGRIDRYTKELTDKLVQVAIDALKARRPGRLSLGHGSVGFAKNRRPIKDPNQTEGPVDRRLSLLVAKDEEGKLIAVLANYACHCTTLGSDGFNAIHGDWAGVAANALEADHFEGAIALISIGCGADANPLPRGTLELVNKYGHQLADEVNRMLRIDWTPIDAAALRCTLRHIDLPHDKLPTKEELAEKAKQPGTPGYHAKFFLEKLERGEALPKAVRYPIACWSFGDDLAMVFLGGEVVVDYSIRLRGLYDEKRLWINAYANDVPCYIPSERILREGGYEADSSMLYYGRVTRLAPSVENQIIEAVGELVPKEFLNAEKTGGAKTPGADAPGLTPPVADARGSLDFPPAKTPAESMATITLKAGLKLELVASEPLIADPVAFDWGPDGRLWVVEMHDYPDGLDGKGKPGGRVKVLTDTDGDGRYDAAKTFLDGIPFPTGIKVWRRGALVTAAPLIFYAEDTDGDGAADKRETLCEGFGEGNQQHRVNGLRWGFDGWLYVGNGDSGGTIKSLKTGQIVNVSGRDLRIRPDTGEIEAQSGQTQYGRCRDDWGNWFGGNNSNPMWHYVLDDHYLRRNPHFAPPPVRQNVSVTPGASRIYPLSRTLARFNDLHTANHFTSACSPEIYRDTWLGEGYYGNAFICEPVHNLIHRELMEADGVSWRSRRAPDEQTSEFLASTDNWFRPVMIRTGPDGALWVADMYRFVIEHPKWIPAEWQKKLDLRAGDQLGRIYRIVRADQPSPRVPRLEGLDGAGLVKMLQSSNGIVRDMAQEQLLQDPAKVAEGTSLKALTEAHRHPNPAVRVQAAATVAELIRMFKRKPAENPPTENLSKMFQMWAYDWEELKDPKPEVRRTAIRFAEECGELKDLLKMYGEKLADDPDPGVRMQFAYSLGSVNDQESGPLLGKVLARCKGNPHAAAAVLCSLKRGNYAEAVAESLKVTGRDPLPSAVSQPLFKMLVPLAGKEAGVRLVQLILTGSFARADDESLTRLAVLAGELRASGLSLADVAHAYDYDQLRRRAREVLAAAERQPVSLVKAAIVITSSLQDPLNEATLFRLLSPRHDPEVQSEAAAALARIDDDRLGRKLVAGWTSRTPAVRGQLLDAIVAREAWAKVLLDAIEAKQIPTADLDARRRSQLASHKSEAIRARAQKLFEVDPNADRAKVVIAHQDVLAMPGDVGRGKAVFAKRCAQCHRLEDVGHIVGPDFAAIKDRSPAAMLTAVLDPNRAVEDRYVEYVVELKDGRSVSGIIAEETSTSLTLLAPEGKRQTVLRGQLESLKSLGRSLMAEGMEKDLTKQDLADVLAYVAGRAPPSKAFPGNEPAIVKPNEKGELVLSAATARISGPSLVFEQQYKNLGYWSSPDDRAEWTVAVAKAGKVRVILDFACDARAAGDEIVVQIGAKSLRLKVPSTGTWDDYRSQEIGTLDLAAGPATVTARSADTIRQALLDLRAVRLVPAP